MQSGDQVSLIANCIVFRSNQNGKGLPCIYGTVKTCVIKNLTFKNLLG